MPRGVYIRTEKAKRNISLSKRGDKHYSWKGGKTITPEGYVLIYKPNHPCCNANNYVLEHRLVMEAHLGRVLLPNEIVHHINGVVDDNCIENLMLYSSSGEHSKNHFEGKKRGPMSKEQKRKISKSLKGHKFGMTGKKHSEESKRKMSEAKKRKCFM